MLKEMKTIVTGTVVVDDNGEVFTVKAKDGNAKKVTVFNAHGEDEMTYGYFKKHFSIVEDDAEETTTEVVEEATEEVVETTNEVETEKVVEKKTRKSHKRTPEEIIPLIPLRANMRLTVMKDGSISVKEGKRVLYRVHSAGKKGFRVATTNENLLALTGEEYYTTTKASGQHYFHIVTKDIEGLLAKIA